MTRAPLLLALTGSALLSGALAAQPVDFVLRELAPKPVEASPSLPPTDLFPVQLVLDDDSAESTLGVGAATARQFLWFNQFAPPGAPFELREIWVLFPADPNVSPGDAVELVVYQDDNADPSVGAQLLLTLDETIQAADGDTFSIYPLPVPLPLSGEGQLLLGVVNRFVTSGASPPSQPAAFDTGASQGRSWLAVWSGDPPNPPELPPDVSLLNLDSLQPGNWIVRGFGVDGSALSIPTLGDLGQAFFALLLAAVAWCFLILRR